MPLFYYKALSEKGKKFKGFTSADNLQEAKLKLLQENTTLIHISALSKKESLCNLKKEELLHFTSELAKLLSAGLPLYESLLALEEKYQGYKSHRLILDLLDSVKMGKPLSEALSHHPKSFDKLFISMIKNAEQSASLEKVLNELVQLISKQSSLKKQLISTLTYPCLLSVFSFIVLGTLIFFVIPSLFELFEDRKLNAFTEFVLQTSRMAILLKPYLLAALFLFISFIFICFYSSKIKEKIYSLVLKLPFLKPLFIKIAFIRFCRSSSTLLSSGVSLVETLELSKNVMNHPVLEAVISEANKQILQGKSLSEQLKKSPHIPRLVSRMLGVAEEGGKTPEMLQHISAIYEEELDKTFTQITTIAQPVILLFIGAIVGFVLLSVLIPLTDVSSFVIN